MTEGIRIRWKNDNGFENAVRIYRSETTFDENTLPEIYATLPTGSTEYIDTGANPEATYFYLVSMVYGSTETFARSAIEATAYAGPLALGELYQGGYYIGNITVTGGEDEGVYAVLMAGKDGESGELRYKTTNTATALADSLTSGRANTDAMIDAGIALHPAGEHCVNWRGGGFDDWYMPARSELQLAYANRVAIAQMIDLQIVSGSPYWSSSQNGARSAWRVTVSTGYQSNSDKTFQYLVRPVRRIRIK